jgi:hypothetical protein
MTRFNALTPPLYAAKNAGRNRIEISTLTVA